MTEPTVRAIIRELQRIIADAEAVQAPPPLPPTSYPSSMCAGTDSPLAGGASPFSWGDQVFYETKGLVPNATGFFPATVVGAVPSDRSRVVIELDDGTVITVAITAITRG